MKVFANREIRNLFQAVLAVWAVALALTQGVAWHTTHAFSFGSLFVFLLLGGCLWGILFCYFQRQSALLEQAVQQIQSCLDGNPDARLDCDREKAVKLTCGTYAEPYLYGYSGGGVGK